MGDRRQESEALHEALLRNNNLVAENVRLKEALDIAIYTSSDDLLALVRYRAQIPILVAVARAAKALDDEYAKPRMANLFEKHMDLHAALKLLHPDVLGACLERREEVP